MATIDQLDISVYNAYAIRTRTIEQINAQLRLDQASTYPPEIQLVDLYPKLSELDLLLGVVPMATPGRFFSLPKPFPPAGDLPSPFSV